ncbi:MAG TPA: Gfo/Idh/MocA family oxidoreductase [Caulobacteraceae bacterium]|nr:Gfo/Idh/MocA family oxidoreductase [Caulobacteraceae bacterium]
MAEVLRAGVIGAGVFGGHHAAQYARLEGVALVGVYDHHREHAEALAARHGARAFADEGALIAAADLISIATPATAHALGAVAALRAGRSVYVEKPMATELGDAERILAEARQRGLVAACGFLERAGFAAMGLFAIPERPLSLEAARLGPPSPRNLDVSVVLDLMIHDLDLALALGEGRPAAVEARGSNLANDLVDEVAAEVHFEDGFACRFHASRVARRRERTMRLVYPSGEIRVDFLSHAFENTTPFCLDAGFAATPAGRDRLGASLAAFVGAVRGAGARPLADAEDGARALDLALRVEQALGR